MNERDGNQVDEGGINPWRWRIEGGRVLAFDIEEIAPGGGGDKMERVLTTLHAPLATQKVLTIIWGVLAVYPFLRMLNMWPDTCLCDNGTSVSSQCPADQQNCIQCDPGYRLTHRVDQTSGHRIGLCVHNHCVCNYGKPKIGLGCPLDGLMRCESCLDGRDLRYGFSCRKPCIFPTSDAHKLIEDPTLADCRGPSSTGEDSSTTGRRLDGRSDLIEVSAAMKENRRVSLSVAGFLPMPSTRGPDFGPTIWRPLSISPRNSTAELGTTRTVASLNLHELHPKTHFLDVLYRNF